MSDFRPVRRRRRVPTWLLVVIAVVCLAIALWLLGLVGASGHVLSARSPVLRPGG